MNILVVAAVLPYPLYSGGQIRMYNLLKRLSKKHRITLVSFIRSDKERVFSREFPFCDAVHMVLRGRAWQPKYYLRALLGKYPFLLSTYDNALMRTLLSELITKKHFDLVHMEPFYVMPSMPAHTIPTVVSEHNVEYDVYDGYVRRFPVPVLRALLSWDVYKLKKWEHLSWKQATVLTAVSSHDAEVMGSYLRKPVAVVANGVDLASFPFVVRPGRRQPTVLFVGNFRWHPNRDAANTLLTTIWPEIALALPGAKLTVVGMDMPEAMKKSIVAKGGTALTSVPDIAKVYKEADILVAPHAIAGGTKFKMLEAMASGLPIITSPQGMAGLDAEAGEHYFEATTPAEFVAHIVVITREPQKGKAIALRARRLVEKYYNWDGIAGNLERAWREAYEKK